MNAEPHTHEVKITAVSDSHIGINYGDQYRTVWKNHRIRKHWWSRRTTVSLDEATIEERVATATKEMIHHHDLASIAEGEREQRRLEQKERYQRVAERQESTWGSTRQ